jgi:thiol-disulfide isomerase/thioredoxin
MRHSLAAVLIVVCTFVLCSTPIAGRQEAADAFDAAMQQGERALKLRQYEDALQAFKRANGLREKKSPEAQFAMARVYRELNAHKSAVDSCTEALKHVGDRKPMEIAIRNLRGLSIGSLVEKNDDKRLKDAEADFRAIAPDLPIAQYNLGFTLVRQGRDDEGIVELKAYLIRDGSTREAAEARRIIENPKRARAFYAPEFSVTTLQGEHIALEDLRGRVVLLDFWATWCGPCIAATPGLVRLQKKYAEAPFTLVGVSLDRNKDAWRSYIEKEKMEWPQYLDNGRVASLFKVRPIPTYIILDHEGAVRAMKTGYGRDTDGWLDYEIKKALKDLEKAAETRR